MQIMKKSKTRKGVMNNKEELTIRIGKRLKVLRKESNLTLKQLAEATNLSPALLSRIENGHAMPSILTLQMISNALKSDISECFKGDENLRYVISRKSDRRSSASERGYEVEYPAAGMHNPFMEPAIVRMKGKDQEKEVKEISHGGQEFVYVIEGTVEMTLGNKKFILKKGDTVYFDGEIPHKGISLSKKPARSLNVHLIPGRRVGTFEDRH
jgi:transcriptional regulator with XRE-family HTH domain